MRNLILALRLVWAVRSGPCLHPFYCCIMPPGERWWPGFRCLVTLAWYAFLLAVIVFIAWLAAHTGVN